MRRSEPFLLAVLLELAAALAWAQGELGDDRLATAEGEVGDDRLPTAEGEPQREAELAALPEGSLATLGAIPVSEIRVEGSTVFTADELRAFTSQIGRAHV